MHTLLAKSGPNQSKNKSGELCISRHAECVSLERLKKFLSTSQTRKFRTSVFGRDTTLRIKLQRLRILNILLADEQDIVRRGLRDLFASHREWSICAEARNGQDAIRLALEMTPDIVILGIDLPGLGGIEAASRIRQERPSIEILFYTYHDEEYLIADALRTGARGYVLKSDGEDKLIEAVGALANHFPFFSTKAAELLLNDLIKSREKRHKTPELTHRERDVLQLLADGKSNREIASRLEISAKTVETHRSSIMRKLRLNSITELVRYAIRNKLIQP
jgi:DNA-binding NarL/FixJ family response regulator